MLTRLKRTVLTRHYKNFYESAETCDFNNRRFNNVEFVKLKIGTVVLRTAINGTTAVDSLFF